MKHIRDLAAYAADLGLQEVRVEPGGKHLRLVGVRPSGSEVKVTAPSSPSDSRRGERNTRAQLRRLVQPPAGVRKVGVRVRKRPRRPGPTVLDAVKLRAEFQNLMEENR